MTRLQDAPGSRVRRRLRDDRGAASIFVLAVGLVLIGVALVVVAGGAARIARHQAQAAADFGALAGGAHAIEGQAAACAVAARYVQANHGRMAGCAVEGLEIVVHVEVRLDFYPASAGAAARAGPVTAFPGGP
ncbi:helicase/secretion neighborhood TadE-like protein [Actinoplanes philippinensis]|uniref:Helicase/secretion neighborhood TadE-like protein n=1 Tax=Actinoplanes philippinensis TaxID=35752 RepID=A0A1I2JXC4_9ACTN|nr:Rv3654c family TadE-like protein [Actinoplanes philippinensis]SFF59194.1 helicase/secretion neighborhood TadE-like protein [Actinoplanes philippinensis]